MNAKWELSLLYDFYGGLLNRSQQRVVELTVNDDLSLSECAELLGISRQGVKDALDRAKKKLCSYEEKLSLLSKYREEQRALEEIAASAEHIRALSSDDDIRELSQKIQTLALSIYDKED